MERMTTCQTTNFVIVVQCVDADSTRVTGVLKHGSGNRVKDVLVIVHVFIFSCRSWGQRFAFLIKTRRMYMIMRCMIVVLDCVVNFIRCTLGFPYIYRLGFRSFLFRSHLLVCCCGSLSFLYTDSFHASGSARWRGDTSGSRQALSSAMIYPCLIFSKWETLVHFVHGHELLLSSAPMRAGYGTHINVFAIRILSECAIPSIISETVLDTNDDPKQLRVR